MAITRDEIFALADQLDAAGQSPTLASVRKALGGGSFTSISPFLSEWKAHKAAKDSPLREPAPPSIAERLAEFGAQTWATALELANGRLANERAALDVARAQLEAEKQEAAEMADQISAELETLKARAAALETAERAAQAETERGRAELATVRERLATAEVRVTEVSRRADTLEAELKRTAAQNAELVKTLSDIAQREKPEASHKKGQ